MNFQIEQVIYHFNWPLLLNNGISIVKSKRRGKKRKDIQYYKPVNPSCSSKLSLNLFNNSNQMKPLNVRNEFSRKIFRESCSKSYNTAEKIICRSRNYKNQISDFLPQITIQFGEVCNKNGTNIFLNGRKFSKI